MSEELVEIVGEQELYELEKYVNDIWQFLPIPIAYVSGTGVVLDVDVALENLLKQSREELIGGSLTDFCFPGKEVSDIQQKTFEKGFVKNKECGIKTSDGQEIPVLVSTLVRKDDSSNAIGFFVAFFDITDVKKTQAEIEKHRKQLNEKINELEQSEDASLNIMEDLQVTMENLEKTQKRIELQNIQLKKLDKIKSDFLNITSHELRTPMSAIKGYIQMILKRTLGEITEEQKQALTVIVRNTNRLDNLIQDILDISRLESGTMKFISEPTNIQQMTNEAIETTHLIAETKTITLSAEVEQNLSDITMDKERIKQVIMNLINNAIKFSPNKSTVILRAKKETNNILFEVQDHGRGIPKEHQTKIFDTFYQVDSGMDRKFGGAGLGLAIARGIVLSHGGNIWVESSGTPGEGSTFKFTIPLTPVKDLEGKFREVDIFRLKDTKKTIENDLRNKTVIWEEETKEKGEQS